MVAHDLLPAAVTNGAPDKHLQEELSMAWKTPKIVEIALGAEINSYACAE